MSGAELHGPRAFSSVARAFERSWPSLLAASVCGGLALANWISIGAATALTVVVIAIGAIALLDGASRLVAVALALAFIGLLWGSLRLQAMGESILAAEVGDAGPAEVVVTGPVARTTWSIRALAEVREFRGSRMRERVLLVLPMGRSPPTGAIVDADVVISQPRGPENGFDERTWLENQGIHVVVHGRDWRQIGTRGGLAGIGNRLSNSIASAVESGAGGLRGALVLGIVLGEDQGLPASVRHDFKAAGLYHLLAVSGQNVAFIAAGVFGLGWLLRVPRIARELAAIAGIAAYVLAVGWQPSVVRAGVAGALTSLAWLAARPRDRWHFLAVGALILLAWSPTSALEPGFQLSFAAVASIFTVVPRLSRRLEGYPVPRRLGTVTVVAFACGLATAPIVLLDFGVAPVYTIPANVLAEPAMPAVLGLGLLAAVVDPVAPGAAATLAWLAGWAALWLDLVARAFAALPGAQVRPHGALVLLVATLLVAATAALVRREVRRR